MVAVSSAAAPATKPPRLDVHGDRLPEGAVARLGTVRFQTRGNVHAIALSPGGSTVVTATYESEGARVGFLDTTTGKVVREFYVKGVHADRIQFTPDGKSLVFGGWDGIKMIDARTGNIAGAIEYENRTDSCVALTADGKRVAVQSNKYVEHAPVGIWDAKTGKELVSLPGRGASCKGLTFGPDGKRLLLSSLCTLRE
jgi:WD40 repeat protein